MSKPKAGPWLALDIGGANLKAAHQDGSVRSSPFAVWKHPQELANALSDLATLLPPFEAVALTMTAELCDCFRTKAEGVLHVLDAAITLAGSHPLLVWGTDGRFHQPEQIARMPHLAAASNWLALATWAARLVPEGAGLLIDIGSTTTDLIPLQDGRPVPRGRTDTERLRTGELVYAGMRRTPVCALATHLVHLGQPTGVCAELFATTQDVYLVLDALQDDAHDLDTADGRPATREFARDRLARMVGADRDGFSMEDARELALSADEVLMSRLLRAAQGVCGSDGSLDFVVTSGSGEWLATRLARLLLPPHGRWISLSELWNPDASSSACARALVQLAQTAELPRNSDDPGMWGTETASHS